MNESINWLLQHRMRLPAGSALIDVGAYHGQFAEMALREGLFSKAWLFEPNSENLEVLKQTSFSRPVTIIEEAVSDTVGNAEFRYDRNLATGSLLPYLQTGGWVCSGEVKSILVTQTTLDQFSKVSLSEIGIGLIKIDTQGADLRVLRGAEHLIESHRPWLAVEMIFVPLYEGQSDPHEILGWCKSHEYSLAGFFDDHYSSDGWLSYADAVFVPCEIAKSFSPTFKPRRNHLQENEIAMLRRVCDERLELINRLHEEAEKRLVIIRELERKLQAQNR